MVDFYGFHVGKYTSPMDPMGNFMFFPKDDHCFMVDQRTPGRNFGPPRFDFHPTRLKPVAAPEFCDEHGGDVDVKICPTKRRFFHCKKVVNKYTQNGRTIQVFRIYKLPF